MNFWVFKSTRSYSSETGSTVFKKKTTFQSLFLCCTNFYTVLKTTHNYAYPPRLSISCHTSCISPFPSSHVYFSPSIVSWPRESLSPLSSFTSCLSSHFSLLFMSPFLSRGNEIFFPEKNDFFLKRETALSHLICWCPSC